MQLFLSTGGMQHLRVLMEYGQKNVLISFAYRDLLVKAESMLRMNGVTLFYDSGAFTAWNRGGSVDVEGYKRDLRHFDDLIHVAANIDVIPGKQGQTPTQEECAQAAEQGWANFDMFRKEGFSKIIHIFHQGDDFKWLHRLIDESEYFGVSPSNDCTTKEKEVWLDHVFRVIDNRGKNSKTHAFGVTSEYLMTRYPWYSVDSSSFAQHAGYGACILPGYNMIRFSDKKPDDPRYIENRPMVEREGIKSLVKKHGFSIKQLATEHFHRVRMNIITYRQLEAEINAKGHTLFYGNQKTLFDISQDNWGSSSGRDSGQSEQQLLEREREVVHERRRTELERVSDVERKATMETTLLDRTNSFDDSIILSELPAS